MIGGRPRGGRPARLRLLAMAVLLILGCEADAPPRPSSEGGSLSLELTWETERGRTLSGPKETPAEPVAPVIDSIAVQVHRFFDFTEVLLNQAGARIQPGQTSFWMVLEVQAGGNTSVEVFATGVIVDETEIPEAGRIFFGRASGLTVVAGEELPVQITLFPFYPRGLEAAGTVEEGYRLDWLPVQGADRYLVRRFLPGGGTQDDHFTTNFAVFAADSSGAITERLLHRIRAENSYIQGAFSDTIGVEAQGQLPLPPAPIDLVAEGIGPDSIRVTWDYPHRDPDAHHIERQIEGGDQWVPLGSVPGSARLWLDPSLAPRTTYAYRVRSELNGLLSAYAGPVSATTYPVPPDSVSVTETGQRTVLIGWIYPPPDPAFFGIWKRNVTAGGAWQKIQAVTGAGRFYEDAAVVPATTYEYAVDVEDKGLTSVRSDGVAITLEPLPLSPPSGLNAIATGPAAIDLSWTDTSSEETGFIVERRAEGESGFSPVAEVGADTDGYGDAGLTARTVYTYRVRARDATRQSDPSNEAGDRTWPPPVPYVNVTPVSHDSLEVDWLYDEISPDTFRLERSRSGETAWTVLDDLPGAIRQFLDWGLAPRTTYLYRIRAIDQGDLSPYGAADSSGTRPEQPTEVAAVESPQTTVLLNWTYPPPDPASTEVWKREIGVGEGLEQTATLPGTAREFEDAAVGFGRTYEYAVLVEDATFGRSKLSDVATITIQGGGPPSPPAGLLAEAIGSDAIVLTWTDTSDNETSFLVERWIEGAPDFSTIATLPVDTERYDDTGLVPRVVHTYRVRARGQGGDSDPSNEATDRTWPLPPSGVTTQVDGATALRVSWSFPSPDPEFFLLERRTFGATSWLPYDPLSGNLRSAVIGGLGPRTTYQFRLQAGEDEDTSSFSEIAEGATPPPIPGSFDGVFDDDSLQVVLGWTFTDQPDPESFEVQRGFAGQGSWGTIFAPVPGQSRGAADTTIEPNQVYEYRLRAVDRFASGADTVASGWAYTQVATPLNPPDPPTSLTASRETTGIRLQWLPPAGPVTEYEIYRRRQQDSGLGLIANVDASLTQFLDTNVRPARTYTYAVRARNQAGASGFSDPASATTSGWRRIEVRGGTPPSRRGHCGVWNPDNGRVLIYGGGSRTAPLDDFWEYDPTDSTWTPITGLDGDPPEGRYRASAAYDPVNGELLIEGGRAYPYEFGGWRANLSIGLWTRICQGDTPEYFAREGTGSAWLARDGWFYSFGGTAESEGVSYYQDFRRHRVVNDTCAFRSSTTPPSARSGHLMASYVGNYLILFGGRDGSTLKNDLWEAYFSQDIPIWGLVAGGGVGDVPSPRYESDGAVDDGSNKLYVLGGYTDLSGSPSPRNDLYMFNFAGPALWTRLDAGGTAGDTDPDATDGLLVVDPETGYLYHVGPGAAGMEVWLYIP